MTQSIEDKIRLYNVSCRTADNGNELEINYERKATLISIGTKEEVIALPNFVNRVALKYTSNTEHAVKAIYSSGKYIAIGAQSFAEFNELQSVIWQADRARIGWRAFYRCLALTDIDLSGVLCIEGNAFEYSRLGSVAKLRACESLGRCAFKETRITGAELGTNLKTIPEQCMYGCESLSEINLENVELIGREAFRGCVKLENIDLTSAETVKDWAFMGCTSLKQVKFGEKLKILERGAFAGIRGLKILLPKSILEKFTDRTIEMCDDCEFIYL